MKKKDIKEFLKKLNKLDIVLVEWVDAEISFSDQWVGLDEATPAVGHHVLARTVGFYVGCSREIIRLSPNYDAGNGKICGTDDIQLSNIKAIKVIDVRTGDATELSDPAVDAPTSR